MAAIKRLLAQPAILLVGLLSLIGLQVNAAAVGSNGVQGDYSQLSKRQTPSFYPIVGVTNKVVERRSITVLRNTYPDIFNMFVLAWRNLQLRAENNDLSHYQVCGIHGLPHIPWQYPDSATVNPNLGYCTHGSGLFLSWHRPYVVLMEQLLHDEAVAIARNFTGTSAARYQAAADDVRLPYWDWASKGTEARLPAILQQASITVTRPGAGGAPTSATIPNPLYAYRFLNPQPSSFDLGPTTVRGSNAGSFDFGASTRSNTYRSFSNARYNDYQRAAEGVHGGVHVNVGGDMAVVDTAGFDPVFCHCQVDRLYAMYQATHPGENLAPQTRSQTFALGGSGPDTLLTPLYPFRNRDGREWTSDQIKSVQSIFTYGYSYPEVPQGRTADDLRTFTTQRINSLYGPNTATASFAGARSGAASLPEARREWSINVLADPRDFSGSHRITFFLGSSNEAIGQAGIFRDTNDKPAPDQKINITVPVTSALVDNQVSLDPVDGVPFLKDLRWVIERAGKNAGGEVPASNFPSLQIVVSSAIVDNKPNQLPAITNVLTHVTPTDGKTGGLQADQPAPIGEKAPPALDSPDAPSGNATTS